MENSPQKPRTNGALLAALIIMTGLAGVSSYLYFDQKKVSENQEVTISERVEELSTTRVKLDSISTALDAKIAEVQKLGGDVTELQKVKAQLEEDRASLRRGNRVSIAKYETKIKQYEAFLIEKDTLIANLQRENVTLATNVKVLDEENTGLKTERQRLSDSVATIATQNQELSTKVTRAAALKAQNVKVFAVSSKGKVKEDDAYKAKRLDKIKLVYTLLDNPLTREEPKEVFVRVLDPSGAVVSDMANGSGTFTVDGNETIYTTKQTVNYTSNGQNVELLYTRGIPYKPGKYTVELYSEGFRIGAGEFAVR
ncbi:MULTISPECIES: hypothetical protein [Spirosoma]|uniref:Chromosome segregation protein SMC n=1 Tax=Spirosoma sordidisoli TaxID=2502893 RepID=A0A4Q2UFA8_9BACT|nr:MULTISPECIES: hypothetical protein [Spirosoma]RYC67636.1 hypothetical protein EQG79_23300 [Spirosoma sordidisoli]